MKLPYDTLKKQQKEFAYVDFATEADCQEALKNHEEVSCLSLHIARAEADSQKIRDTTISIVLSNPPKVSSDFNGRGRGGSRGIRGARGGGRGGLNGGPNRSDSTGGDKTATGAPSGEKKAAPAPAPVAAAKKD